MGRGGARPGSGRPRKSVALHRLHGTYKPSRHGEREASTAAVLAMPLPSAATDWQPSPADWAALSPRARDWLEATLSVYVLNAVEGRQTLEACRVLTRVEALEAEPGMAAAGAVARERRLFLSMWEALRLER